MKEFILVCVALALFGCSESENLTGVDDADLSINYSVMEANPKDQIIGGWILTSMPYNNEFNVFGELKWLKEIQDLEVSEYVVSIFFYPSGKWHMILLSSFTEDNVGIDTIYLVGEYIVTDTDS